MAKFTVGLTGGIGSGKTTVSTIFQQLGIDVIDADIIARDIVKPGTKAFNAITEHFGSKILTSAGQLDRTQLRTLIFSIPKEREWLNNLLHPLIRQEITTNIRLSKGNYCILSAPLLLENQMDKLVNRVLIVDVSKAIQIQRTLARDSSNQQEIEAIINSQITRDLRLTAADDVIDNQSSNFDLLTQRITELHQRYEKLSQELMKNSAK